jgi:hypothetical protein
MTTFKKILASLAVAFVASVFFLVQFCVDKLVARFAFIMCAAGRIPTFCRLLVFIEANTAPEIPITVCTMHPFFYSIFVNMMTINTVVITPML